MYAFFGKFYDAGHLSIIMHEITAIKKFPDSAVGPQIVIECSSLDFGDMTNTIRPQYLPMKVAFYPFMYYSI